MRELTYTFGGPSQKISYVKAHNKEDARHMAMVQRWGPPDGVIYGVRNCDGKLTSYKGLGLVLINVKAI
jgi:hypothetical protein